MKIIRHFEIVLSTYHNEIVGRIRTDSEESALYSMPEINNIIALWRMGELYGSFGIGSELASDSTFAIVTK